MFGTKPHFTVFGGSYLPDDHAPNYRFDADCKVQRSNAASWLVVCALVGGISVFAAEIVYFGGPGQGLF